VHQRWQGTASADDARLDPRIARSRAVILAAATEHFQTTGYVGANVDEIAAEARVSKRTIYNIFGGKEQLFRETLSTAIDIAEQFVIETASALADTEDVAVDLRAVACRLARAVLDGPVVGLRRLVIAESERVPTIARDYYERAPGRVLDMLAEAMRRFGEDGLLDIEDAHLAAEHFVFLVMGAPLDRALFMAPDRTPLNDVDARAVTGVEVFLRAYVPT
jgi:TetR/AcrR family transcriptional repressor of mexJK operon